MKKLILACMFLFVATAVYSQFNVGIKLGYNSSLTPSSIGPDLSYTSEDAFNDFINNYHVGVFGRVYFKNDVYIQPEVFYSRQKKAYTFFQEDGSTSPENSIILNTIDVPLLVGYRIVDFKIGDVHVYAGPKVRFDIGSKVNFNQLEKTTFDPVKLGLNVGVGVDLFMFAFDVRYGLIGNLYNTPDNIKNGLSTSSFIFSLGWKIL